ncbi:MAG: stage II sporulation protein M [Nitrospirota bacterium]|jgi:stage II sporulation protein M
MISPNTNEPPGTWRRAISDAGEARNFIYAAIAVFLVGAILGGAYSERFSSMLQSFKELAKGFSGQSIPVLILLIFLRNSFAAFLSVWLGILLGLVPLLGALSNGILVGLVIKTGAGEGSSVLGVIALLLPHGIFEFPAIFLAWGIGLWRGAWPFRHNKEETYRERAHKAYRVFLVLVLPLLLVAAVIEGLLIGLTPHP